MNPMRRDKAAELPPGTVIAEFANGEDALLFARMKGPRFYVSPGINHFVFAVRTALGSVEETATPPGGLEGPPAITPTPGVVAGGFAVAELVWNEDVVS